MPSSRIPGPSKWDSQVCAPRCVAKNEAHLPHFLFVRKTPTSRSRASSAAQLMRGCGPTPSPARTLVGKRDCAGRSRPFLTRNIRNIRNAQRPRPEPPSRPPVALTEHQGGDYVQVAPFFKMQYSQYSNRSSATKAPNAVGNRVIAAMIEPEIRISSASGTVRA